MPISGGSAISPREIHAFLQDYEQLCIDQVVQSGAIDAWGAWIQLTAATVADIYGIHIAQSEYTVLGAHQASQIQIGIGAALAEVDVWQQGGNEHDNADDIGTFPGGFVPLFIPAGTRVSLRVMSRTVGNWNTRFCVNGLTE